jgi:hypothetical protein
MQTYGIALSFTSAFFWAKVGDSLLLSMMAGDVTECFEGKNQQPPGSWNGPTMATGWYL